ncbi:nucleoside diphosphate kinase regulator [Rhodospirillum rubrum]|uniref:GreA/GreB family elongation factor n=1 Tax=Rhodospirillum rubrum (strain ATCC 11170 / ATH 1.1.1 / DSM 467 / LMG 4362 / NCIMB 8255 / S1) TaxID=269796 RepID=Q2RVV2_RHORT|nr:nucleoside diphosphate kinase regulator [Rhodospirillum rubrum]ABC21743.1 GreA/GreB family elongation factor [Rhodospirillum rubrum ATCC 11170]AEO47441.1 nucleoside diphosphate kinase regulator [Rhodospirillum rubrum F11]MBK5953299.1 nucleoside-diphosphate kinase [Rhodospirillum rubrum]QXG81405.1 nucleoside diphosphate kinase regulator [Rhodospirillum rubrum]HAQ00324.1 nucleoside diphosphate kinase regulator [Rhodospirillum rubrum]
MSTSSSQSVVPPPVVIDHADHERLQGLALRALAGAPDLAGRLLAEIDRARVLPSESVPADVVTLGAEVTFRDESTGRVRKVTLVYPGEADIDQGKISIMTPIGVALIGLAVGASIDWLTRDGDERHLSVLAVRKPE